MLVTITDVSYLQKRIVITLVAYKTEFDGEILRRKEFQTVEKMLWN